MERGLEAAKAAYRSPPNILYWPGRLNRNISGMHRATKTVRRNIFGMEKYGQRELFVEKVKVYEEQIRNNPLGMSFSRGTDFNDAGQ